MKKIPVVACIGLILLLAGASTALAKGQGEKPKELEKVEITWWINPWRIVVPGVPEGKTLDGTEFIEWASKAYMEIHPNVTVTGVLVSNAEFPQKQAAAIAAGNTPNVIRLLSGLVELSRAGLLLPLDGYISAADRADFVPVALADATVDGKVMQLPWNFGNNGMGITNLIYPPMFEASGVDWKKIVEKGWTMDEFVAIGKKVSKDTNGDGQNDVFLTGFQAKAFDTDWPMVYNHGGRLLNDKETAFAVDSAETIAGYQFIVDAIYKHNIAPKGAEAADNYGVIRPFHAHQIAMGNGGPYEIGRIDREVKAGNAQKFRPYVAPYPEVPGKRRGTYLTSGGFSVFKKAKTPATLEAAVDFAQFLTSKEMLVRLESLLYISGRKSANAEMYKSPEWLEFKPDIALYEKEISDYGVPFWGSQGFLPKWGKVKKYMQAASEAVYARTKTPEQAMKDFIKDANKDAGF